MPIPDTDRGGTCYAIEGSSDPVLLIHGRRLELEAAGDMPLLQRISLDNAARCPHLHSRNNSKQHKTVAWKMGAAETPP